MLLYAVGLVFAICTILGQLVLLKELVQTDKFLKYEIEKNKFKNEDNEWVEKFIDKYLELSEKNAHLENPDEQT